MLKSRIPEIAATLPAAVEAAAAAGAERIAEAAKARVPVNSGRLRDAIHVQPEPEGAYVIAGDSRAWYGHIVEHGSVFMPAHPFLVPALEENRQAVENEIVAAVRRVT